MPNSPFVLEVCIDSIASAQAAETGGAQRVELCDNLVEGGTTPSLGMLQQVLALTTPKVMTMIRPRGGDFLYSDDEFEVMKANLAMAKEVGTHGLVFGILKSNGKIDVERNARLMELAGDTPVTFHRAFDMTDDPFEALETLIELGISRVLTSGHAANVTAGMDLIGKLVRQAGDRIIILPGGGIHEENITSLIHQTGVSECHASAKARFPSAMEYRNPNIFMGAPDAGEFEYVRADLQRVQTLMRLGQQAMEQQ